MDKARQQILQKWLQTIQPKKAQQLLKLSVFLGVINASLMITQMALIAFFLKHLMLLNSPFEKFQTELVVLLLSFILRGVVIFIRDKVGFAAGSIIKQSIREQLLDKLSKIGAVAISSKAVGSWVVLLLEQVENLHNFYARYLPQKKLSAYVPLLILLVVFPLNWAAGLVLLISLPLLPLFMVLVGKKSAVASQQNIEVLSRLSGAFLDKIKGLETIKLFGQARRQTIEIAKNSEEFRQSTMDVLKIAFLSSAVLEFFTAISIAVLAVYFGFVYLGELHFGGYGAGVSLFVGFFCLMLAPEFYQPLRELGAYYHDQSAALASADSLEKFLNQEIVMLDKDLQNNCDFNDFTIQATDCVILSPFGQEITKNLNFTIKKGDKIALVGKSGSGKTSIVNLLLGFAPYKGSITINGIELRDLNLQKWREQLVWVGQNPKLLNATILDNLRLAKTEATKEEVWQVLEMSNAKEFVENLGLDYKIADGNLGISGGQAQRLAIARALLSEYQFMLLDEPTASLDKISQAIIINNLQKITQHKTVLMVTHILNELSEFKHIWMFDKGQLHCNASLDDVLKNQSINED